MSDILRLTVDDTSVRTLRVPDAVLDPCTAAVVERAVAAARDEAFAEGRAAGRAEGLAEAANATAGVEAALAGVHQQVDAQRDAATAASLDLAHAAASAVLDRCPPSEATELFEQVRQVTQILDASDLEARVHPDDHAILCDLAPVAGLTWAADAQVDRGQARIDGAQCGADLTRRTLLDAALEALREGAR